MIDQQITLNKQHSGIKTFVDETGATRWLTWSSSAYRDRDTERATPPDPDQRRSSLWAERAKPFRFAGRVQLVRFLIPLVNPHGEERPYGAGRFARR